MDPDETLRQIREALDRGHEAHSQEERAVAFAQAAGLFEALDGWLCRGGFLPSDWMNAPLM